jgi:transcriptional regulator with XRE-family HTH domain
MNDLLPIFLGNVIKAHREAADLSQERLAQLCGLHRNYFGQVERGTRNVSVNSLASIAAALDTRASALLAEAEDAIARKS